MELVVEPASTNRSINQHKGQSLDVGFVRI